MTAFRTDVSEGLAAVVARSMAKNPGERYQTADELAAALEFYLSDFTTSTANTALRAWLRHIAGDERINLRSYVPNIAALQAKGVRVRGFTNPEHPAARSDSSTATPTPIVAAAPPRLPTPRLKPPPDAQPPRPRRVARLSMHLAVASSLLILAAATVAAAAIIRDEDLAHEVTASQPVTGVFEPVLEIRCDADGAQLELDGFERGGCPLDVRVDPGRHVVTARAEGREPVVREVNVSSRDDRVLVMLSLPRPREVVSVQAPQLGRLTLDTVPWTRVYRDGTLLGETPIVEAKLPRGKHKLRLVNPDRRIDRTVTVEVTAGKLTVQRLQLQRRTR